MGKGDSALFVSIVMFWTVLIIFSNMFSSSLYVASSGGTETSFLVKLYDSLEVIPVVEYFVPILRIMTFQYSSDVSPLLGLFLNSYAILSAYVLIEVVKS